MPSVPHTGAENGHRPQHKNFLGAAVVLLLSLHCLALNPFHGDKQQIFNCKLWDLSCRVQGILPRVWL